MKLKYGKRYVRRDGEVTGPLEKSNFCDTYRYKDPTTGHTYTQSGIYDLTTRDSGDKNLETEYVPPSVPQSVPEPVLEPISANAIQHGGSHYKKMAIEPWDYISSNGIGYLDGSAIKYLSRWKEKNGIEDLKKAIHFIEKLIEVESQKQ